MPPVQLDLASQGGCPSPQTSDSQCLPANVQDHILCNLGLKFRPKLGTVRENLLRFLFSFIFHLVSKQSRDKP